jgi:glutaredoxin
MKKFIVLIIITALLWHFRSDLSPQGSSGNYGENGEVMPLFFTGNVCGKPCADMEKHLNKLHVSYEKKTIDPNSKDDLDELHQYTNGRNILPVLVLGDRRIMEYNSFSLPFEIAATMGLDYLPDEQERIIREQHYTADGRPKLVLYGTSWCGYCKKARDQLAGAGVSYDNVDVEQSADSMRNFKKLGGNGYPLIFAGARGMTGYSPQQLNELIDTL